MGKQGCNTFYSESLEETGFAEMRRVCSLGRVSSIYHSHHGTSIHIHICLKLLIDLPYYQARRYDSKHRLPLLELQ